MEKNDFKDYESILENFDAFCDEFESRAADGFMRGDQNDGQVNRAAAESGASTPEVVREVAEPGPADHPVGAPYIDVQASELD